MDVQVMLVDDEAMVRAAVEDMFRVKGGAITTAAGGEDCLAQLEAGFRGVILMDVMMPRMNGWATIREIVRRGLYEGNIIIMLTGIGEPDSQMEGLQEYVSDFLAKPIDPRQLYEAVQHYRLLLAEEAAPHV
ncbi:response regulator [Geobacter sulfurreducens]|uniref:response regulator n=1 Tax=Geobacter sulfurreducens TaxID=35554 RepID=UPI0005DA20B0|nr:response regulator [Geobacter sulfurreducens]AJY69023.1 histidine kinase [Geobacter sulfurreducens]UTG92080.1 response regulator [Geobacter sulfurreducens]HML80053.1 response regulator [Geobacter sulfurreducens]